TSLLAPRRRRGRLRCSRVVSLHLTHARRGYESCGDLLRRLPCSLLDDGEVACVARASSPCISRTLDAATSKSCGDLLRRLPCSLVDDREVACVARASSPCISR